jgi:hypothetical protein
MPTSQRAIFIQPTPFEGLVGIDAMQAILHEIEDVKQPLE